MLSVPPPDTEPQISAPAWPAPSMCAVMATISASNLAALGQTSKCNGLHWEWSAYTRLRKLTKASSP
jgi:hypothetical protein